MCKNYLDIKSILVLSGILVVGRILLGSVIFEDYGTHDVGGILAV